jgi:predicted N-formylglutamate amidohydrolase
MTADPPAVEIVNAGGTSPYVLTCEHASNYIPTSYGGLGLPQHDLARHIAWDIGAADVARTLSRLLDAPLFLSGYSRLLIDCNRPPGSATSIPVMSETTAIPGNIGLTSEEARERAALWFWPFQTAITTHLDERLRLGRPATILGVHSFTPVFKGVRRPWEAGVLFRHSVDLGRALVQGLRRHGRIAAENEPYRIEDDSDYTVPVHGERRNLDAVLIEIRQDLITKPEHAKAWAEELNQVIRGI